MISAWQDQDFEGVAKLFDELWGWELEGSEQEKRDISDLYIAGSALACNRLRVIRENGDIAAYLGSVFYQNAPQEQGIQNPSAFRQAAAVMESRLRSTPFGLESVEFNDLINEANRKLKADMIAKGFEWQGELKLLMTSPLYQGRGMARLLIDDTFDEMRRRGIRNVILYTDSHCNWQYYEKTGWTLAAEHEWSFKEEPIRALAYWKTI